MATDKETNVNSDKKKLLILLSPKKSDRDSTFDYKKALRVSFLLTSFGKASWKIQVQVTQNYMAEKKWLLATGDRL